MDTLWFFYTLESRIVPSLVVSLMKARKKLVPSLRMLLECIEYFRKYMIYCKSYRKESSDVHFLGLLHNDSHETSCIPIHATHYCNSRNRGGYNNSHNTLSHSYLLSFVQIQDYFRKGQHRTGWHQKLSMNLLDNSSNLYIRCFHMRH